MNTWVQKKNNTSEKKIYSLILSGFTYPNINLKLNYVFLIFKFYIHFENHVMLNQTYRREQNNYLK